MSKMTNEEWYRRSFGNLHLSDDFEARLESSLEENGKEYKMKAPIHGFSRVAAAVTICAVAFGSFGVCYAADAGGIRTAVEMWFNGRRQVAELQESEDGDYYRITNEDGETVANFGGLSIDEDGNEVSISGEELAAMMNNQGGLIFEKSGRVTFCYKNLMLDVTDRIGEDDTLHIHIDDPQNPYNYFDFSEINGRGYSVCSNDAPTPGITYYEPDASDLTTEATPAPERSDDVCYGTYVITSDE